MSRFDDALAAIDGANRERPEQLAHSLAVYDWVRRLRPDASEALLLAARACHVRRWEVPRSSYPEGRSGYLKWRKGLYDRHADIAGGILAGCGYDDATIARVRFLIRKEGLRAGDADARSLENALCLEFVENGYADLAAKTEPEKMATIVEKTLAKMSEQGRAEAARLLEGR